MRPGPDTGSLKERVEHRPGTSRTTRRSRPMPHPPSGSLSPGQSCTTTGARCRDLTSFAECFSNVASGFCSDSQEIEGVAAAIYFWFTSRALDPSSQPQLRKGRDCGVPTGRVETEPRTPAQRTHSRRSRAGRTTRNELGGRADMPGFAGHLRCTRQETRPLPARAQHLAQPARPASGLHRSPRQRLTNTCSVSGRRLHTAAPQAESGWFSLVAA